MKITGGVRRFEYWASRRTDDPDVVEFGIVAEPMPRCRKTWDRDPRTNDSLQDFIQSGSKGWPGCDVQSSGFSG